MLTRTWLQKLAFAVCVAFSVLGVQKPAWSDDATQGQIVHGSTVTSSTSCADLSRIASMAPCEFDFTKFRTRDVRLEALETRGIVGSGLFGGRKHIVRDVRDLKELNGKVAPGDQIILADGVWKDAQINLRMAGTVAQPILIRPNTPGGVVFTGTSSMILTGSHLVLYDTMFRDGIADRSGFVVVKIGTNENNPCNDCIVDKIVIDNYNSNLASRVEFEVHYLLLSGRNITVANSRFTNKKDIGTMILPGYPKVDSSCPQQFSSGTGCFMNLLFMNNFVSGFVKTQKSQDKKYKIMQMGWSGVASHSAFSVIEGNTFEHADGDETVSIKASDVLIRNNRFNANTGTLNLRSANRVLVENNIFDGTGHPGMGGVRIEGRGHWIVHNTFKNLVDPRNNFYMPIGIHTAALEDLADGMVDYARAKDIVITANNFEHVAYPPIVMGIYPKPQEGRILQPTSIFIIDNVFSFDNASGRHPATSPSPDPIEYIGGQGQFSDIIVQSNRIVP